jgi:hypothetical protein
MAVLAGKCGANLRPGTQVLALPRLTGYVVSQQRNPGVPELVSTPGQDGGATTLTLTDLGLLHGEA